LKLTSVGFIIAQNKNDNNDMVQLICIGWILGIAFMGTSMTDFGLSALPVSASLTILVLSLVIAHRYKANLGLKYVCSCMILVSSLLAGYQYAENRLTERLKFKEEKSEQTDVIVYVNRLNELKEKSVSQKITVLGRHPQPVQWISFRKQEVSEGQDSVSLHPGRYYHLTGTVRPAHSFAVPGVFDVEKWYLQQNIMSGFSIHAVQELTEQDIYRAGHADFLHQQRSVSSRVLLWFELKRLKIREFIQGHSFGNKGLLLALLTGDESLLDDSTKTQFQRFGMSHLLAISGPHVLILASMVCWCLIWLINRYKVTVYLRIPRPYFVIVPFLSCVVLYCAFVGFEIPALRTLFSSLIIGVVLLLRQKLKPLSILLFSASVLLLMDPFSILSAAFWLSYGACFVLLRIYQTVQRSEKIQHEVSDTGLSQIRRMLGILFISQWKIFFALLPFMIVFFKQIAWITPFSNLFAIPWIGLVIVPLDVIAGLSFFVCEPLSSAVFWLNDQCIALLLWCLNLLDMLFRPSLIPIAIDTSVLFCLILGLILLFLPLGVLPKTWAALCFLAVFLNDDTRHGFELSILDVGQGQSVFIRNQDQSLMVDTGGSMDETQFSIGEQIILPFLSVKGIRTLDYMVLTHLDQDHSGAYEHIKDRLLVTKLLSSEQLSVPVKTQFEYCSQGQHWQMGEGVTVQVLLPLGEQLAQAAQERNETSCVLYVQVRQATGIQNFLLMGDAGWPTEFQLLQQYPELKVDVLVLGHHGSRHSSAYAFLKHYQPAVAVVSAGKDNRYGHPTQEVIQRLKALNIPLYSTVEKGTVSFSAVPGKAMQMSFYRDTLPWMISQNVPEPHS
jgi:competence protein ComEC